MRKKVSWRDFHFSANDIALVKLFGEIDLEATETRAACIPPANGETFDNELLAVTGWGTTSSGGSVTDVLMEAQVLSTLRIKELLLLVH